MAERRHPAGFTLVELLVALALLGLILAGLAAGMRQVLRVQDAQERITDGTGELDAVDRTLRRLFAQAEPGTPQVPGLRGTPSSASFTTTLPAAVAGGTGLADVALVVDGRHRLLLRWTAHRYGVPFNPAVAVREAELLRGVEQLDVAYWSGGWRRSWEEPDLPALVRIRLAFAPGDPRRWPDMVAEVVRHRPPE